MPRYVLDTNICLYLMKHQPPRVAERFAQCRQGDVMISAITYAELAFGVSMARNSAREWRHLQRLIEDIPVAAFDQTVGDAYAPIRMALRDRRRDALDKLIAAHAIALQATLVTNNARDFAHYPGLVVENWLES
jgi:tRNA(fMet)-specific endonuclease VapC